MKKVLINYFTGIALALILIVVSSCNDLLDFQPAGALSDATIFSSASTIELAVVGVYNSAQTGFYLGGFAAARGYPFGSAHIELGDNRGEDVISTQGFYSVTYDGAHSPSQPNMDFMWQTLYATINQANVVLDGLNKAKVSPTLSQTTIDEFKGEMYFIRALCYHELMKNFTRPYSDNPTESTPFPRGVVLRTTGIIDAATADEAAKVGRSTVQQSYDLIVSDLNMAEASLPETRGNVGLKISRATKAAAIALKTRIYLHMQNWASVVTEGNKLAAGNTSPFSPATGFGSYSLMPTPIGPFTAAGSKNNTESIFSIENSDLDNPNINGALASMYSPVKAPINARGLICISPLLWNHPRFLDTDLRKSALMVENDIAGTGRAAKFTKKYSDVTGRSDNAPVIRYAEVLLNMAEAIQRQSGAPQSRAVELLNAVRNRSVTNVADQYTLANFTTDTDVLGAILLERRIEFLCEGLRWGDIHRLAQDPIFSTGGIPAKANRSITDWSGYYRTTTTPNPPVTPLQVGIPYSDYRFIWPMPNTEISVNPVLAQQQNPGF